VAGFGNWFRKACDAAGVDKSIHGVRKASATMAANAGATEHMLLGHGGWSNLKTAQIYTRAAQIERLGREAGKMVSAQIEAMDAPNRIKQKKNAPEND
jgi:hypothetical protein